MTSQLFIVTGASRGLGAAIAEQLLQPGHRLLCMSRKTSDELAEKSKKLGVRCEQWPLDLALPVKAAARLQAWLQQFKPTEFDTATQENLALN